MFSNKKLGLSWKGFSFMTGPIFMEKVDENMMSFERKEFLL